MSYGIWIRIITAYLLCARQFSQNNALALRFWCLSSALTRIKISARVHYLSKYTRKSKYAVIIVINLSLVICPRSTVSKVFELRKKKPKKQKTKQKQTNKQNSIPQYPDLWSRSSSASLFQLFLLVRGLGLSTNHSLQDESSAAQCWSSVDSHERPGFSLGATTPWQRHLSLKGSDHRNLSPFSGSGLFFKMHTWLSTSTRTKYAGGEKWSV